MKVCCIVIILLFVVMIVSSQSDSVELLLEANAAYMAGDYETSQALYETIVQDGIHDFRVYFNLGNAYYESGDLGLALLNYRRAQEIFPRDVDLNNNLVRLRMERVDLQAEETGFTEGLAELTTGVLSLLELSVFIYFIWIIWFILLGAAIVKSAWRYKVQIPLFIVGVVLLLGLCLLVGRLDISLHRRPGIIIDEVIQVRSGPGEAYLELYQLHSAAEIYVWGTKNDWVQFALADGRLGWIPSKTVTMIQH